LDFWFENIPSGNTGLEPMRKYCEESFREVCMYVYFKRRYVHLRIRGQNWAKNFADKIGRLIPRTKFGENLPFLLKILLVYAKN
jgi:hypothetical protein